MRLQIDEGSKNDVIRAPVNDLTQGPQNSFLFMLDSVFKPQFTHFLIPLVLAGTITATVHHIRNSLM